LIIKNNIFITQNTSKGGVIIPKSDDPVLLRKNSFKGYGSIRNCAVYVVRLIGNHIAGFSFIDAKKNYWNDSQGPNDPEEFGHDGDYNTSPHGVFVNDGVLYYNYLESKPKN
jgi:hypothetical protein